MNGGSVSSGKRLSGPSRKSSRWPLINESDAVLITGDVYTSADHNLTAQLDYVRLLHKLAQNNIQVFAVLGNHHPLEAWKAKIPFPPNVHIFPMKSVERVPLVVDGGRSGGYLWPRSYAKSEQRENLA